VRDLGEGRDKKVRGAFFAKLGKGKKKNIVHPLWSSPILASGKLITASDTGELVAINAKTGVVEKTLQLGQPVLIGPIAMNGVIYIATDEAQLIALR
jgi:outer membrane protein assembly factor BamB